MRSLTSARDISQEELEKLLELSFRLEKTLKKQKSLKLLEGYILASLFFEPSTRTRLSFESAMHRLGGRVITAVGVQFSSLAKGESLFDTLKVVESYADICVIRHPVEGASELAARNIQIPVINAGDGAGEHPTQALLDIYTIKKYKPLGKKKLVIAFVGDLKYGRTIHSLIYLLRFFPVEIIGISPYELRLPSKYQSILQKTGIPYHETEDIHTLKEADVAYITRIQEERFLSYEEYSRFKDLYVIHPEFLKKCKEDIIIMHPLPRLNEISPEVDALPNAVYFSQAENGVYTRGALLLSLLGVPF